MIDVNNQSVASTPRYLDRTRTENRSNTEELQSQATRQEQQNRDNAAANNGLLETPRPVVIKPDTATISQLETATQKPQLDNANGLGRTAISSYQSLASAEFSQQMAGRVKVDITA